MVIAFYYHITLAPVNNNLHCPGYIGVFIDSLAEKVDTLYLLMHEAYSKEISEADYTLRSQNIRWINLGFKTPVWHRAIFYRKFLKKPLERIKDCNAIIVRSPSPLAPYFPKYTGNLKLVYMVVGDYLESVEQWKMKSLREWFELQYLKYNDFLFRRAMRGADIMVNSPVLFEKYKRIARTTHQIRTTTISTEDFFERTDTCRNGIIELLFTGRIDPLKGLFELLDAVSVLRNEGLNVRLNIAGWEPKVDRPVERALRDRAVQLALNDLVLYHGRKSVGPELNSIYRMCDIYVLPSHEEGFPRTIWEAMANGLPVITTDVGGIPAYLTDGENVCMIKPKRADLIADAVKLIVSSKDLRQKLIRNGRKIARESTLEVQAKRMVEIIKDITHE